MNPKNPSREAAEIELACAVAHAAQDTDVGRKKLSASLAASLVHTDPRQLLIVSVYRELRLARRIATVLDMDVEDVLAGDLDQRGPGDGAMFKEVLRLARLPIEEYDPAEARRRINSVSDNVVPIRSQDPKQATPTEGETEQ